ncbi:hypothetical protein FACS1894219_10750 [Clostridia bacterium]|nr:hypothetical protein FACS1894219_10750 [Clostridia bacterium]
MSLKDLKSNLVTANELPTIADKISNIFAQKLDSVVPKKKNHTSPFHYLNSNLGFYGRDEETNAFESFLNDNRQVLTLAVTGTGGSGKSKFIFELTSKSFGNDNWRFAYLDKLLINDFSSSAYVDYLYPRPLCLIIDYAGRYCEEIGRLIQHINNTDSSLLPRKIRFLLIERQGITYYGNRADGSEIYPDWFQRVVNAYGDSLELYGNGFLELGELSDDSLKAIALDYRNGDGVGILQKYDGNTERFEQEWNKITDMINRRGVLTAKIRTIRPLIVLFMVDSSIRNLDFYKWSIDDILKNIIARYKQHWLENLCSNDASLCNALKRLLMYSTACESWNVGDRVNGFENESELLNALGKTALSEILPYINEYDVYEGKILAFEPDLLGEFFVLEMLKDIASREEFNVIVRHFWEANADSFAFFLQMCVDDYSYSGYFKELFEQFNELFLGNIDYEENDEQRSLVAGILLEITYVGISERTKDAMRLLGDLVGKGARDEYLLSRYVFGLYNQCHDASLEDARDIVNELRAVAVKNTDDAVVCGTYCEALYNLVVKIYESMDGKMAKRLWNKRVTDIEALVSDFITFIDEHTASNENSRASALIFFTRSLCNAALYMRRQHCTLCFDAAARFIEPMQVVEAIDMFAHALADFAARDDIRTDDVLPYYEYLKRWIAVYESNFEKKYCEQIDFIANIVAKVDCSAEPLLAEAEAIYNANPTEEIAVKYAMALNNFAYANTERFVEDTTPYEDVIERIGNVLSRHKSSRVAEWYCKAQYSYFKSQMQTSPTLAFEISERLLESVFAYIRPESKDNYSGLLELWFDDVTDYFDEHYEAIAASYAQLILQYSELLVTSFPSESAFAFLCGLRAATDESANDETLARELTTHICNLYSDNEENEPIARCYLEAVAAISMFLEVNEIRDILPTAEKIYARYPNELSNADSYALIISNYTPECEATEIGVWLDKALSVYADYSDSEEILSYCLSILEDYVLETSDTEKTDRILAKLTEGKNFTANIGDELKEAYENLIDSINDAKEADDE